MKRYAIYIGFILIVGAIIGGIIYAVGANNKEVAQIIEGDIAGILPSDYVKGNKNSGVVLVKYSDFECPSCAQADQALRDIIARKGDRFALVYRHFPLSQIHRNADGAARASEAAGRQGKFWEMHDKIFDTQRIWAGSPRGSEIFAEYARELGLDMEKYTNDVNDGALRSKINEDYKMGVTSGVRGTPTFFINGTQVTGLRTFADLEAALDTAYAASNGGLVDLPTTPHAE